MNPEYVESESKELTGWYYNSGMLTGALTPDDYKAIQNPTMSNGRLICDDDLHGPFATEMDAVADAAQ